MVVWEWGGVDTEGESVKTEIVGAVYAATHAVLTVLQSWLASDQAGKLVVFTHGAVGLAGEDVGDLAGAAVWGLVRSAQSEHPGRIVLIDTDAPVDAAALVATDEPQLLVRTERTYAARLTPIEPPLQTPSTAWQLEIGAGLSARASGFDAAGTVLVTGGTGMAGAVVARHVVERYGVGHVVLASRGGEGAPGAAELVAELSQAGAQVQVLACDVANRDEVAGLLARLAKSGPPLTGVINAAGCSMMR